MAQTDSLPAQRRNINFADNPETIHRPCPLAPNDPVQQPAHDQTTARNETMNTSEPETEDGGRVGWNGGLGCRLVLWWIRWRYGYLPPSGYYLKPPLGYYPIYSPKLLTWVLWYKIRFYLWKIEILAYDYYRKA